MMGSLEEAIEGARTKPDVGDEVINDLDIEEEEVDVENQEVFFLQYSFPLFQIQIISPIKQGKRRELSVQILNAQILRQCMLSTEIHNVALLMFNILVNRANK